MCRSATAITADQPAYGGSRPESGKTEGMTSEPDAPDLVLVDARQVIERTLWASGITGVRCAQLTFANNGNPDRGGIFDHQDPQRLRRTAPPNRVRGQSELQTPAGLRRLN
jgi:hypothetical protein